MKLNLQTTYSEVEAVKKQNKTLISKYEKVILDNVENKGDNFNTANTADTESLNYELKKLRSECRNKDFIVKDLQIEIETLKNELSKGKKTGGVYEKGKSATLI